MVPSQLNTFITNSQDENVRHVEFIRNQDKIF